MQLIIGDIHFGRYTNNITWLENQLRFFREQIFQIIRTKNLSSVVFLGDLFEIRYSINQQVGIEVKKVIKELATIKKDLPIYFVAGNHDYYSPLEEFVDYNAYDLIFGEEFTNTYKNIHFINKTYFIDNDRAYLPWYTFENIDTLNSILTRYPQIKVIYTHTDLNNISTDINPIIKDKIIYSGHIHYLFNTKNQKWHNTGAACALDFGDSNSKRYIYLIDDNYDIVEYIENVTTPKFKRFYNEDIFTLTEDDLKNSKIEIYISKDNLDKVEYKEKQKEIKEKFIEYNIKFKSMDREVDENNHFDIDINPNIHSFIEDNIPSHLMNKYKLIKEKLTNQ